MSSQAQVPMRFILSEIQTNEAICKSFINSLNSFCPLSLKNIKRKAYTLCPDLKEYCGKNEDKFNGLGKKDKGSTGKWLEFYVFGQLPNGDPNPDLPFGDIKSTHLKYMKNRSAYNAKERLTITNCGKIEDYASFKEIESCEQLKDCKYYNKMQKGILGAFKHDGKKYNEVGTFEEKMMMGLISYDNN